MDEVISSAIETKVVFKVMDCEPFTILIGFMKVEEKSQNVLYAQFEYFQRTRSP